MYFIGILIDGKNTKLFTQIVKKKKKHTWEL